MRRAMLLLVLAALLAVTAARAYVQDRSPKTGAALRWKGGALTLTLARAAPSQDLSDSEVSYRSCDWRTAQRTTRWSKTGYRASRFVKSAGAAMAPQVPWLATPPTWWP